MTIEKALNKLSSNARDPAAWETVANAVYRPLLAYVGALLLTFRLPAGETAHDITHDVLFAVYQKWWSINPPLLSETDLNKYIRASCRNLLIDRYRREQRAEKLLEFLTAKYSEIVTEAKSEEAILVEQLIGLFPPEMKCAPILRLYMLEDMTRAEIADQIGEPPATFYRRWKRCWEKVEEILQLVDKKPDTQA